MAWLTIEDARIIEQENGLEPGSFAGNREATPPEAIYLGLKPLTPLAFQVHAFPGVCHLYIVEFPSRPGDQEHEFLGVNAKHNWDPFQGDREGNTRDQVGILSSALNIARIGGLREALGEDLLVFLTGATQFEGFRSTAMHLASAVENVYVQMGRGVLMAPQFAPLPPAQEGMPSPGLCIQTVRPACVLYTHSILFRGGTTYASHDAAGILQVANSLRPSSK